jgi:hypothetical protein
VTGHDVPDRDMPNFLWPGHRDVPMIGDTFLAALLAGTQLPPSSGPELRPLAEALAGLRARPASDELEGEAETLAAFRSQFGAPRMTHRPPARASRSRRRLLPVKAAAAAAVLSLGGLATAAYAGALPATVQRFAHDIAGAPAPASRPALTPAPARPATTDGPAYGLCAAWAHAKAHGSAAQRAAAFRRLTAAVGGAGNVTAYCATAAPPGTSAAQPPQPSPAPRATGKPSGLPAPRGSGKPTGLPSPHGTGAPTVRPTPRASRADSPHPAPAATKSGPAESVRHRAAVRGTSVGRCVSSGVQGPACGRSAVPGGRHRALGVERSVRLKPEPRGACRLGA